MSNSAAQYIKTILRFSTFKLIQQVRKLGINVKRNCDDKALRKIVSQIDMKIVQEFLARQKQNRDRLILQLDDRKLGKIIDTKIPYSLKEFLNQMKQVNKNNLNYYYSKLNRINDINNNEILKIAKTKDTTKDTTNEQLLNEVLGIRTQIYLSPNKIRQYYQYPRQQIQWMLKTLDDKHIIQIAKKQKIDWKKDDRRQIQQEIILSYQHKKSKLFHNQIIDKTHQLFQSSQRKSNIKMQLFIANIQQYQNYYKQLFKFYPINNIIIFIKSISPFLDNYLFIKDYLHLTISTFILQSPYLFQNLSNKNQSALFLANWVIIGIFKFIKNMRIQQSNNLDPLILLKSLVKYKKCRNIIKTWPIHISRQILIGTQYLPWPQNLLTLLEQNIKILTVAQLSEQRIIKKFQTIKLVIQFIDAQNLQPSPALLQKILVSIQTVLQVRQTQLLSSSSQHLFMEEIELVLTNNICFALIKLIFRFADINNNMIIIVKYLWRRVLDEKINEQSVKSGFLLIDITNSMRQTDIVHTFQLKLYQFLFTSITAIKNNSYQSLRYEQIKYFIEEEALKLLSQQYSNKIRAIL